MKDMDVCCARKPLAITVGVVAAILTIAYVVTSQHHHEPALNRKGRRTRKRMSKRQADGHDVATGAYNAAGLQGRQFGTFGRYENECLAEWMAAHFLAHSPHGNTSVVELGCGIGNYARYMASRGFAWVDCSDGNPTIARASRGLCKTRNLVQPQHDLPRGDFAYSLEVGEHIPQQFMTQYLDNLDRANRRGLVLSWSNSQCAKTGAGQHVNCLPIDAVVAMMKARGYTHEKNAQNSARASMSKCPKHATWLASTLMVFSRDGPASRAK